MSSAKAPPPRARDRRRPGHGTASRKGCLLTHGTDSSGNGEPGSSRWTWTGPAAELRDYRAPSPTGPPCRAPHHWAPRSASQPSTRARITARTAPHSGWSSNQLPARVPIPTL